MWRTTVKSLTARWRRLLLTGAAVVIGVAFITGALVLTDTASRAFDAQFAQASEGVDLTIRSRAAFGAAMGVEVEREPLDEGLLSTVRAEPGVQAAAGRAAGQALLIADGEAIVPTGPSVGLSWQPAPFNAFTLRDGRAPEGDGEVVIDAATAVAAGLAVGERVEVQTEQGTRPFTVVGLAGFGDADGLPNVTVALFAHDVAQQLFGLEGRLSEIAVVADGPAEALRNRLAERLGAAVEIATAQDTAAASAEAAKEQLRFVGAVLLMLAATALLVGALLIANTFAIVVAQRTRELALLRAVGATGRQVRASVLIEAAVVGAVASLVGVVFGLGAAVGLRGLVAGAGVNLPAGGLVVTGRTLLVALLIGVGVTVSAAFRPARRAARVAPVAAMRGGLAIDRTRRGRIVRAVVGLAGWPFARLGVPGTLARHGAQASPRRTAATATALALGVAVVTVMTVLATSARTSLAERYREVVTADVVVESARGEMLGGLPPMVHHHVAALDQVTVASGIRYGHWLEADATRALTAVDPASIGQVLEVRMVDGDLAALADGGVALAEQEALARGLDVGDELVMTLPRGGEQRLRVVAVFDDAATGGLATGFLLSLDSYAAHFVEDVDAAVFVRLADGVGAQEGLEAVREAIAGFPTVVARDQAEAREARTAGIDGVLALVTVLLLLAVGIALLGIANTLGLSIVERTRELGLLRAVGMTRAQVAAMVRFEATLVAVVGGVAGVVVGLLLGWLAVAALASMGLRLAVPVAQLASYALVSAAGGAIAGVLPARRAARLDVLAAVGTV